MFDGDSFDTLMSAGRDGAFEEWTQVQDHSRTRWMVPSSSWKWEPGRTCPPTPVMGGAAEGIPLWLRLVPSALSVTPRMFRRYGWTSYRSPLIYSPPPLCRPQLQYTLLSTAFQLWFCILHKKRHYEGLGTDHCGSGGILIEYTDAGQCLVLQDTLTNLKKAN